MARRGGCEDVRIEEAGDEEISDERIGCRLQTADPHNLLHPLTIRSDRRLFGFALLQDRTVGTVPARCKPAAKEMPPSLAPEYPPRPRLFESTSTDYLRI